MEFVWDDGKGRSSAGGFLAKVWLSARLLLGGGTNPSPGPPRLKNAPAAGHPLPKGESCHFD
jgi:hypothetical protein